MVKSKFLKRARNIRWKNKLSDAKKAEIRLKNMIRKREQRKELKLDLMKLREQNALKVRTWRLAQNLPKRPNDIPKVLAELVRNMSKKFKDFNMETAIVKSLEETSSAVGNDKAKDVNRYLRQIKAFKNQNNFTEQKKVVSELREKYGSYKEIAEVAGMSKTSVFNICKNKTKKKHKGTELAELRKKEIEEFWNQEAVSQSMPGKAYAGKKFLISTLKGSYGKYRVAEHLHENGMMSLTTLRKYKPANIKLMRKTPWMQCLCSYCEDTSNQESTLIRAGMVGISSVTDRNLNNTYCDSRIAQNGGNEMFPMKACIFRECGLCGIQKWLNKLKEDNSQLLQENNNVFWWEWNFKDKTRPLKILKMAKLEDLLKNYCKRLGQMSGHRFRARWHRNLLDIQ